MHMCNVESIYSGSSEFLVHYLVFIENIYPLITLLPSLFPLLMISQTYDNNYSLNSAVYAFEFDLQCFMFC